MGKTIRGTKRATMKNRKRRTDKHQAPPPKPLDERRLVGKPPRRVRRGA